VPEKEQKISIKYTRQKAYIMLLYLIYHLHTT